MKRSWSVWGSLVILLATILVSSRDAQAADPYAGNQWAIDFLDLTEAWAKVQGNAYVDVIDLGLQFNHEDLRAFPIVGPKPGNFRLHLSYDLRFNHDDPCPDEFESSSNTSGPAPCDGTVLQDPVGPGNDAIHAGHGTHVSGILAATPDNGLGITGACRHCSLLMSRIRTNEVDIPQALYWGVDRGSQIFSGSFGIVDPAGTVACPPPPGQDPKWNQLCEALALADQRDVVMVFAAGNNLGGLDFPARYQGAIGVGGVEQDRQVWRRDNDSGEQCPDGPGTTLQCGSNFGPQLDLIAPAENIFSTVYTGKQWITDPRFGECGDGSLLDGYGYCTGTSMSTPFVAGIAGLVRSANPLLSKQNVYDILTRSADRWPTRNDTEGYGVPNARTAVDLALGLAPGRLLTNRLTPLFSFYSPATEDHLYTTVPQVASSAVSGLLHGSCTSLSRQDCPATWVYQSVGSPVPGYSSFPGVPPCNVSPCFEDTPKSSVYIFTGEAAPYTGAPALVPLYRMTYTGPNPNGNQEHRDTTYTTAVNGLNAFRGVGYELDGIEGYIFPRCTPEPGCMPAGTVRLYRRYHPQRDDFAIFPESQLAQMEAAGYTSTGGSNLNEVIGYVYPNVDGDGDHVIDGFEGLIGTDPSKSDTDCDGLSDGTEVLGYPYTDPLVANSGPGCTNLPPTACFTWTRDGKTINFNASCSTDDHGISDYAWTFGDGSSANGSSPTVSHPYSVSGFFTVRLKVTDTGGLNNAIEQTVNPDEKPVASFTWSCALRTCTFDGSSSTDNQPIPTYEWTLGDGNVKYGKVLTHTYSIGGIYPVRLKVTDTVSQTNTSLPQNVLVNQPPSANADLASTVRGVAIDINVLANDSDLNGDALSVNAWTQPAHGSVVKNPNGTLRYTPVAGYTGPDLFKYNISDGKELSSPTPITDVSIDVRPPNKSPDARDDGWSTYQNGPTNIPYSNLLANDYDPDGDALTVTGINTAGLTGTLDCSFGTYCRYTPPSWFLGTTSFTYSASDGKGGTDPAIVRIKVGGTNGAPVPQDDIQEAAYNTQLTFTRATLLVNDSDPDGDVLSVMSVTRAVLTGFGNLSCSAANYVCTYTPPAGFTGVDVLTYRATDGITFADARIRILVRPPSPAVLDAREDETFFTSAGGTFLSYTWMTSNDYDPEGGALTVVSVDTTGLLGTLDCTTYSTGCQYTRGTSDPTRFRYTVRDPQGNLATTTVTLKPGNWSFNLTPVIANDQLSTRANTPLAFSIFDVLRNDYDPDNDQLDVSFSFASTYGRVSCTTPAYFCTYTPNAGFTGTDTLTYWANDRNNSVQGSVTMIVQPVIAKDAQILSQTVPVSLFAGQTYPVTLRIKNVGTQTWGLVGAQCNAFRLGSINPYDNTTWGSSRTELPSTVAPGGEVTVSFTITAPSTPGTYSFQRRMVHECVEWFGDLGPNVVVTVSQ